MHQAPRPLWRPALFQPCAGDEVGGSYPHRCHQSRHICCAQGLWVGRGQACCRLQGYAWLHCQPAAGSLSTGGRAAGGAWGCHQGGRGHGHEAGGRLSHGAFRTAGLRRLGHNQLHCSRLARGFQGRATVQPCAVVGQSGQGRQAGQKVGQRFLQLQVKQPLPHFQKILTDERLFFFFKLQKKKEGNHFPWGASPQPRPPLFLAGLQQVGHFAVQGNAEIEQPLRCLACKHPKHDGQHPVSHHAQDGAGRLLGSRPGPVLHHLLAASTSQLHKGLGGSRHIRLQVAHAVGERHRVLCCQRHPLS
eukprot:m.73854 g.73854  ORF g.73854 m.73854 type:complete len:304 (+) comp17061_c0_seq1:490-1401(+)